MVKSKKKSHKGAANNAKERHKRNRRSLFDQSAPLPQGLEARLPLPKTTGKHHSYFEFVENVQKKKKLEFQVTNDQNPPPGFTFVPIGNPELTTTCKEMSRERGAMIFIVSTANIQNPNQLSHHIYRIGHHIRQTIVEEAQASLSHLPETANAVLGGDPEPLPESQDEYTKQVNSVIRDLFPRIPHTDRQAIIMHAFNLSMKNRDPKPVGLCEDLPLSRRVQLAVLAHIRHTHTRYDQLLKETQWETARRVVEGLCLDILVKWRGDEETGRDQLDEILREVVVISDSDNEDSDDTEDPTASSSDEPQEGLSPEMAIQNHAADDQARLAIPADGLHAIQQHVPAHQGEEAKRLAAHIVSKKEQRGFKRYRAWEEALQRSRGELEPYRSGPQVSGGAVSTQDAANLVVPEEQELVNTSAGSVPNSNGFVPPSIHRSLAQASFTPGPLLPPSNGQPMATMEDRDSRIQRVQRVSPSTHRLQDMLVRSIEPASPDVHGNFPYRRLEYDGPGPGPGPGPVSPTRPGEAYHPTRPEQASRTWNLAVPYDRPSVTDRGLQDVSGIDGRRVAYRRDFDVGHGYVSHDDPQRLRSPVAFSSPNSSGTMRPNALNRTVIVNAPRPGERSNPIFMEDRGGFFERVRTPSNGGIVHFASRPGRPDQWLDPMSQRLPHGGEEPMWDQRPRHVARHQDGPDVHMLSPGPGPGHHPAPMQPLRNQDADRVGSWAGMLPGSEAAVAAPPPNLEYRQAPQIYRAHDVMPQYGQPPSQHFRNERAFFGSQQQHDSTIEPSHHRGGIIVID